MRKIMPEFFFKSIAFPVLCARRGMLPLPEAALFWIESLNL
jgi:hypothetical protein